MSKPLVIENLVKNYGPIQAVRDVSLEIRPGEVFGLLGPNGAGKTSIISCVVTLENPTSGSVRVFDHDVFLESKKAKRLMGVVPQEIINHGYFNAEEILEFHSGYYGIFNNKERIHFLMKELQLWDHRKKRVKQLSGGMKRRLMIAKSLVHSPKLLLLDEPTAGVDIELRSQLWEFVKKLRKEGTSVLLTTHYLEEAEQLCDRVGVMNHGQVMAIDETKNLVHELTTRQVSIRMKNERDVRVYDLVDNKTVGDIFESEKINSNMIEDVSVREGTLEDAFRRIIQKSSDRGLR